MGKNPWKSHGLLLMEISWNFSVRDDKMNTNYKKIKRWNTTYMKCGKHRMIILYTN